MHSGGLTGPECVNGVTCQEAAQWYFEAGFRPIPWEIRNGTKVAAVAQFSYKEYAAAPLSVIEKILGQWQDEWQVGFALSEGGKHFAIDVDSYDELSLFEEENGALPGDTWVSTSGRQDGGRHYLFRSAKILSEWPRHGKFSRDLAHLEIISNGLLAVPPSRHPSGRLYQWEKSTEKPAEVPLTLALWLNNRQTTRSYGSTEFKGTSNPPGRLEFGGGIIPEGSRNAFMVSLSGSYRFLGDDADAIVAKLKIDNVRCDPPLEEPELRSIAEWAERQETGNFNIYGEDLSTTSEWAEKASTEEVVADTPDNPRIPMRPPEWRNILRHLTGGPKLKKDASNILPRSDLKVVEFMERYCRGNLTYVEKDGQWRLWDRKRHAPEDEASAASLVMAFAEGYRLVLEVIQKQFIDDHVRASGDEKEAYDDYKKAWGQHRAYRDGMMNDPVQSRILRQLKKRKGIVVSPEYFDAPKDTPYLLNFLNGTYDVRTGSLRGHSRDDRLTMLIKRQLHMDLAKKPLPEAAPKFWSLLWRMCGGPGEISETRHWNRANAVWRWSGYQCHGSNPEKKMAIYEGASNIGKNQLEEILAELLGPDLAHRSSSAKLLMKTKGDRHDSISNVLIGRRMVLVNELSGQQVLDDQQILVLVNPEGSQVDLRHLHHDSVPTEITWKITVTTNQLARADLTPQVINRLLILPLSLQPIPPDEQFEIKREILEEESDAVLAHMVAEWRRWYLAWKDTRTGLIIPPDAVERLNRYQDENEHPAALFVAERCRLDASAFTTHTAIWRMCEAYYKDQHSEMPIRYTGGRRKLYTVLDETPGVERELVTGTRRLKGFSGIEVLPPEAGSKEQMLIWDTWTGS